MSHPVIKVENLSKHYRLGKVGSGTIRHDVNRWLHRMLGKEDPYLRIGEENDRTKKGTTDYIWALRDINFDVQQGEVLGIIGRNGAGKSTLLKILSKVTAPTSGIVKSKGKIASLLEVGTGFHPELSGRDNIFLNGAILGMTKKEIQNKFDEIVDFSGVERYIDTPVKRYSSGMYVRLAFSVAAHLDPEILIVDEVLAVGDAEFQKKCLGKMKDVSGQGRTVLFVSHNMNAVLRLCQKAILLNQGSIYAHGSTNDVIHKYLGDNVENHSFKKWNIESAPGNYIARLLETKIMDEEGNISEVYDIRKPIKLNIIYEVLQSGYKLTHAFVFHDERGNRLFDSHDVTSHWRSNSVRKAGIYDATLLIPGNFFAEGKIKVSPAVITSDPFEIHFYEEDVLAFMVVDSAKGDSVRGEYAGTYPGLVRPLFNWEAQYKIV